MEAARESLAVTLSIAVAAAVAVFLSLWGRRWWRRRSFYKYPPTIGSVLGLVLRYHRLYDHLTEISRRHKTFRVLVGLHRYEIYTCDPAVVEHILSSKFHLYGKGSHNRDKMGDLFGEGIFVADGSKWLHQRKLSSQQFSARFLKDYSSKVFKKNAAKLAEVISCTATSGEMFDVQVAFGVKLDCMQGSDEEEREFVRAFDESSALLLWRYLNPLWRLQRLLNVGSEAKLRKNIDIVDGYIYKMINMRTSTGLNKIKQGEDILSRFLLEREENPREMSLKYLRDIILNFVIAGKDSTGGTLSWFFFMLCSHPSVQEKIYREVQVLVGKAESLEDFTMGITEAALSEMNYLRAALSETLRLYPADTKMCFADDRFPNGFDMRKGDGISYQPYAMGRMTYLWGDDAEEFRPERWLDEAGVFRHESPYKFTAFQAGPRICLGKDFAYRQMMIFAAVLVRFFVFELGEKGKAVFYKPMLTLHIDGGLGLRASRRQRLHPD
ncbi:cytochrome P450 704C1-like isoform X2 [Wolffia australiana]